MVSLLTVKNRTGFSFPCGGLVWNAVYVIFYEPYSVCVNSIIRHGFNIRMLMLNPLLHVIDALGATPPTKLRYIFYPADIDSASIKKLIFQNPVSVGLEVAVA